MQEDSKIILAYRIQESIVKELYLCRHIEWIIN